MKKLNAAFAYWVNEQIVDHPLAMWADGVRDYIKQAEEIESKCKKSEISTKFTSSTAEETKISEISKVVASQPAPSTAPSAAVSADTAAANKWLSFPESKFTSAAKPFSFGTAESSTSTSTTAAKPTPAFGGFTMPSTSAAPPDNNSSTKPSLPTFQFGQLMPSAAPATNLFSLPSMPPTSSTGTGAGMFSIPAFGAPLSNMPAFGAIGATAALAGDEEDGDDAGEPILEPEKALRNEQDTDEIVFEATNKLMRFDKGSKEWKDMGKGIFRITRAQDTKKPRMLMRSLTGKIMFNAGFHENISFEKVKGGVKFSAVTAADGSAAGELNLFIVKVKESEVPTAYEKLTSMTK
jgi:hypothetical protein